MSSTAITPSAAARLRSVPVLVGTVAAAAGVAAAQGSVAAGVLRAVLVLVLVPCALIDLERRIIPNRITGPAAAVALGLGFALDPAGEPRRILWAALAGGFLLLAALAQPRGMGMGDVKLVAVMGLFLGPPVALALFAALTGNLITAVVLAVRHGVRAARRTTLPFGPYLAGGGLIAALVGSHLLHLYLA